jgi:hypothetical protein
VSLSYVNLVCDLFDGQGNPVIAGSLSFAPDATLASTTDHVTITQAPILVGLLGNPLPVVQLAATDNASLSPPGWRWQLTQRLPGASGPQSFYLAFANGATQYLSDALGQ